MKSYTTRGLLCLFFVVVLSIAVAPHCELFATTYTLFVGFDVLTCCLVGREQHPGVRVYLDRHESLPFVDKDVFFHCVFLKKTPQAVTGCDGSITNQT